MNSILPSGALQTANAALLNKTQNEPSLQNLQVEQAFQDFVAGTFYKQMLDSLHKTHDKAAYFHGGSAEELFQGQLDQQIAEDLARDNGAQFSKKLFEQFQQQTRL